MINTYLADNTSHLSLTNVKLDIVKCMWRDVQASEMLRLASMRVMLY